ncbi:MAG: DUF1883 domain-containing protein [Gaiellaceae bacterium]
MSEYLYFDLGSQHAGDIAEVSLSGGANVRLLDSSNFSRYKRGDRYQVYGGLATESPARIPIPRSGHWYVVVDMQGLKGSVRAGVRLIPGSALKPLPPIRQQRQQLSEIAHNVSDIPPAGVDDGREFDVFISHATEDKDAVVRPLAVALQERGLRVWYDEFELKIGDSLRQKIDQGIAKSRFGVVVLSHSFFAKGWPQYELDGLVTMAVASRSSCRSGTRYPRMRSFGRARH